MVFAEDAVISALGKEFDDMGYSLAYHEALVRASKLTRPAATLKRNTAGGSSSSSAQAFIEDVLPKRKNASKASFADLVWEKWTDGLLYAKDPDTGSWFSPVEWAQHIYEEQQKTKRRKIEEPKTNEESRGAEEQKTPKNKIASTILGAKLPQPPSNPWAEGQGVWAEPAESDESDAELLWIQE